MFDGPVARLFPVIHVLSLPETASFAANVLRVLSFSPLIQPFLAPFDNKWLWKPALLHPFTQSFLFDTHALYGQRPQILAKLSNDIISLNDIDYTHFAFKNTLLASQWLRL
jgi:hypothetical protein